MSIHHNPTRKRGTINLNPTRERGMFSFVLPLLQQSYTTFRALFPTSSFQMLLRLNQSYSREVTLRGASVPCSRVGLGLLHEDAG